MGVEVSTARVSRAMAVAAASEAQAVRAVAARAAASEDPALRAAVLRAVDHDDRSRNREMKTLGLAIIFEVIGWTTSITS